MRELLHEQDRDVGWRGFQAQLLQCWVGEAIAHVIERFAVVTSDDSSKRSSVALLSLLSNDQQQQHLEDTAAFANISAFVKQFLTIQRTASGGKCSSACGDTNGDHGDELCVVGVADVGELKLWLQSHHEKLSSQYQHSNSSCLVVLYSPLLPLETQEEIAKIVITNAAMSSIRTLVLLINDPIGLMDVTSADSSSSSSSCYRFIDSHTQAIADESSSVSSSPAIASRNSCEQYLVRPLKQLGVQCGLRFVMEIARWTVFTSEETSGDGNVIAPALRPRPPPMLTSVSQMPFQLLLLALRWSHFHPALVRAFAKPFERKLRLIPQNRIRSVIFQLQEQEMALWRHLYAAEEFHDRQLLGAPIRRLQAETAITSAVVQMPDSLGKEEEKGTGLKKRLSQCYLWDVQKQFYLAQGIKAWSDGIIPFGVSSSSFLAAAYARMAVDFLLEASASRPPVSPDSSQNEVDAPNCFVWEAASGSCKFLHAFLVHFYRLLDQQELAVRGLRPCVVASDLSDQVLESRMVMTCFEPFLRDRRLEFARFDTSVFVSEENRKQLLLKHSQRVWQVGRDGPVFLMGNYFFDSLRTDVFAVTRSPVSGGDGGDAADLKVFEGRADPQISSIADLELSFHQIHPFEKPTYDDPFVNQIFLDVLGRLDKSSSSAGCQQPSALILFPVEAIEFIRTLMDSTANDKDNSFPVGVMIGDASFSFRDPIPSAFFNQQEELFEIPQLSPHPDCFCLPVDFEILRLLLKRLARSPTKSTTTTAAAAIITSAQVASAIATDTFDVLYGQMCPQSAHDEAQIITLPASSSMSQVAFAHEFASFTPSDCDLLWGMMGVDNGAAHFSLKTQLALLVQSAWDFDLFVVLQWTLIRFYRVLVQRNLTDSSGGDSEQLLRVQLIAIGRRCWRTYYVLDGDNDYELSLLQLCRWFFELNAFDEVIALLSHNIKKTPELEKNVGICYLLALALFHTEDFWHALVFFRKCFVIAPKRIKFQRRIAQTLLALQKQKLQAKPGSGD